VSGHLFRHRKIRNILRDPRVALSLEAPGANPIGMRNYAVLYGRARITEGGAPELLQHLAYTLEQVADDLLGRHPPPLGHRGDSPLVDPWSEPTSLSAAVAGPLPGSVRRPVTPRYDVTRTSGVTGLVAAQRACDQNVDTGRCDAFRSVAPDCLSYLKETDRATQHNGGRRLAHPMISLVMKGSAVRIRASALTTTALQLARAPP
jgi:hypothetical protein